MVWEFLVAGLLGAACGGVVVLADALRRAWRDARQWRECAEAWRAAARRDARERGRDQWDYVLTRLHDVCGDAEGGK